MYYVNITDFLTVIRVISTRLEKASDDLCRLDGQIGDGDHGTTMANGFSAIVHDLLEFQTEKSTLTDLFNLCGESFLNAVGATTGPLYASAFLRAGVFVDGRQQLEGYDVLLVLAAMCDGIYERGNAQMGNKTMMDVWLPIAHCIRSAKADKIPITHTLEIIPQLADESVAMTKAMVASKGRAARLGERSLGHIDPGAASASIIIKAFSEILSDRVG